SPTRKVTGALNSSRSSQRNTGIVQGKTSRSGSVLRWMASRNIRAKPSDAGGELVRAPLVRPADHSLDPHLQPVAVASEDRLRRRSLLAVALEAEHHLRLSAGRGVKAGAAVELVDAELREGHPADAFPDHPAVGIVVFVRLERRRPDARPGGARGVF